VPVLFMTSGSGFFSPCHEHTHRIWCRQPACSQNAAHRALSRNSHLRLFFTSLLPPHVSPLSCHAAIGTLLPHLSQTVTAATLPPSPSFACVVHQRPTWPSTFADLCHRLAVPVSVVTPHSRHDGLCYHIYIYIHIHICIYTHTSCASPAYS